MNFIRVVCEIWKKDGKRGKRWHDCDISLMSDYLSLIILKYRSLSFSRTLVIIWNENPINIGALRCEIFRSDMSHARASTSSFCRAISASIEAAVPHRGGYEENLGLLTHGDLLMFWSQHQGYSYIVKKLLLTHIYWSRYVIPHGISLWSSCIGVSICPILPLELFDDFRILLPLICE